MNPGVTQQPVASTTSALSGAAERGADLDDRALVADQDVGGPAGGAAAVMDRAAADEGGHRSHSRGGDRGSGGPEP